MSTNSTPTPATVKTTAAFVPLFVLVKPRVNQRVADELMDLGIELRQLTPQQDAEKRARQEAAAKAISRDAYRGDRVDATGVRRPDAGTPVYGWDEEGRTASLFKIDNDLTYRVGLPLKSVHLEQKPGDRMYVLILRYGGSGEDFTCEAALLGVLVQILGRVYEHIHIYRNPNGSVTINAAHALDRNPDEVRYLRMDEGGHILRDEGRG